MFRWWWICLDEDDGDDGEDGEDDEGIEDEDEDEGIESEEKELKGRQDRKIDEIMKNRQIDRYKRQTIESSTRQRHYIDNRHTDRPPDIPTIRQTENLIDH